VDPIVLATGNRHKIEELRAIFGPAGMPAVGLTDLPAADAIREPVEHGETFGQNASIKALGYAAQTGRACLADDSGLEVDALGGAPGVISSHYSTNGRETGLSRAERDQRNNERLLRELAAVPPERRAARFVCVMTLARPGRVVASTRGEFHGRIGLSGDVPRGTNGFGYDPLFLVAPDYRRTSAELDPATKNSLSHRGRAARAMADWLRSHPDALG
jgi:XTP/dITP diphosphohydrolase